MQDRNSDSSEESSVRFSRRDILRSAAGLGLPTLGVRTATAQDNGGDLLWEFDAVATVRVGPTVVNGSVFIGTSGVVNRDGRIHALDTEDGTEQWTFETSAAGATGDGRVDYPVTVTDGLAFFNDTTGRVRAYDTDTYEKQWQSFVAGLKGVVPYDGTLICTSSNGLYGVDAETGTEYWQSIGDDQLENMPAVSDGMVYTVNFRGDVLALDAGTGRLQWRHEMERSVQRQGLSPTVANGTVFHGDLEGALYALDAATGEKQWTFETGGRVVTCPTVFDGIVLIGVEPGLYAIDVVDGTKVWQFDIDHPGISASFYGAPTVADGTVFAGSNAGLFAVDLYNGNELWRYGLSLDPTESERSEPFNVASAPIVRDGVVFFGAETERQPYQSDGSVLALDAGLNGSSKGSRVLLGTNGHHGDWAHASRPVQVDIEETIAGDSGEVLEVVLTITHGTQLGEMTTLQTDIGEGYSESHDIELDGSGETTVQIPILGEFEDSGAYEMTVTLADADATDSVEIEVPENDNDAGGEGDSDDSDSNNSGEESSTVDNTDEDDGSDDSEEDRTNGVGDNDGNANTGTSDDEGSDSSQDDTEREGERDGSASDNRVSDDGDNNSGDGVGPGFGIGGAIAALGTLGYLLEQRMDDETSETNK